MFFYIISPPLNQGNADKIGEKSEHNTYTDKHSHNNDILFCALVHLKENENTHTRPREETGHHSTGRNDSRHRKLGKSDR